MPSRGRTALGIAAILANGPVIAWFWGSMVVEHSKSIPYSSEYTNPVNVLVSGTVAALLPAVAAWLLRYDRPFPVTRMVVFRDVVRGTRWDYSWFRYLTCVLWSVAACVALLVGIALWHGLFPELMRLVR